MKKVLLFLVISFLSFCLSASAADSKIRQFDASGEVVTVDPVYSQITISHGAIKDFSGSNETLFSVTDKAMLKDLSRGDLVDFHITDTKGDVQIDKLSKTGIAPPKEDGLPVGEALQQTINGAGEVVRTVTSPIPPVSEAVGGATKSTSSATDPKIRDGNLEQKTTF